MSRTLMLISALALLLLGARAAAQVEPRGLNDPMHPQAPAVAHPAAAGAMTGRTHPSGDVANGEVAPGFTLDRMDGGRFKLADLRGHWVALCFGDRRQSVAIADSAATLVHDALLAIHPVVHESVQALRAWHARHAYRVTSLADASGEVAMVYGCFDNEHDRVVPGLVLVDPQGIVRLHVANRELSADEIAQSIRSTIPALQAP